MKTSLVIISTLLVLCVLVPFILFIYNSSKTSGNIKKQSQLLLKTNGIVYGMTDIWRKNFIGISKDKKTLTSINFNKDVPSLNTISLADIKQCNLVKKYNTNANKTQTLQNLDLELVSKSTAKPNLIINFFNLDQDIREDFESPRIEKWHQIIKSALTDQPVDKMVS